MTRLRTRIQPNRLLIVLLACTSTLLMYATWTPPRQTLLPEVSLHPEHDKNSIKNAYRNEPKSCWLNDAERPKMVLIISSRPSGLDHRRSIRETWGKTARTCGVKILFGFGQHNRTSLQKMIDIESKVYGDILQSSTITDGYHTQTDLILSFFQWAQDNCDTPLLAKGDDDTWINFPLLMMWLENIVIPNYIAGILFNAGTRVIREDDHVQRVDKSQRDSDFYPPYASGVFYVFPFHLLKPILETANQMTVHWVDDAFITGDVVEVINYLKIMHNNEILRITRVALQPGAVVPDLKDETASGCQTSNFIFMHKITAMERKIVYDLPCLNLMRTCRRSDPVRRQMLPNPGASLFG